MSWGSPRRRRAVSEGVCSEARCRAASNLLQEGRPQPGRREPTDDRRVGLHALDLELEEVLERDHVALHPLHLGDRGHPARAVVEPVELDDQVERRRDLLADRLDRQVEAGHQHHRLDAGERVAGRVGVHRRERAVVAGVHRLEHVERLGAADLADDDPVGPHAQRVAHQVADRDLALALDVRRARLQPDHVLLVSCSSAASSIVTMRSSSGIAADSALRSVVLPEPVPPEIRMFSSASTQRSQELDRLGGQRSEPDEVVEVEALLAELADREQRARERQRRDDRVDAGAVGQAGVDHRRRLVDAAADLADDLVDDPPQVRLVVEAERRLRTAGRRARSRCRRPVDHDLGDRVVGERAARAARGRGCRRRSRRPAARGRRARGPASWSSASRMSVTTRSRTASGVHVDARTSCGPSSLDRPRDGCGSCSSAKGPSLRRRSRPAGPAARRSWSSITALPPPQQSAGAPRRLRRHPVAGVRRPSRRSRQRAEGLRRAPSAARPGRSARRR